MKRLFIVFIFNGLLLIPSTRDCFGQNITWQRIYRNPLSNDAVGYDVCQADANNFYIVGIVAPMFRYIYVLKINQWGDTIWTRILGFGEALGVASSNDGGCVFTGTSSSAFAIKIKPNGDTAWTRSYTGEICYDIKKTPDNGYILCGDKRNGFIRDGYICKIDSSGDVQWERLYSNASFMTFQSVNLAIDSNGYVIGGATNSFGHDISLFLKINNNGDTLWQKTYSLGINSTIWSLTNNNTGYFLSGTTYLGIDSTTIFTVKVDLSGNLVNSKIFPSNFQTTPRIVNGTNNKFYLSFHAFIANPPRYIAKIFSLDSNLNTIKQVLLIPDTNSLMLYSLFRIPNSTDIIGCGNTDQYQAASTDIYGVRLDSALNPPPPIAIKIISSQIPNGLKLYQNYPNPFNLSTIISFELVKASNVKLLLYNVLGEEIKTALNEHQKAGYYRLTLRMNNYSSGVYFYRFIVDGSTIGTKKLILIK